MKKIVTAVLAAAIVMTLGACGSNDKKESGITDDVPKMLEVNLEVPEKAESGEKVLLKATVTQGDEKVDDAEFVKYEIWEAGNKEKSDMHEAKHEKGGVYTFETEFKHDGVYTVQVHVQARNMHNMPKKDITVGKGDSHDHAAGHHSGDGTVSLHLMEPEHVKAGKTTVLMAHLQDGDHPLEKAEVRFEIWNHSTPDKHDWVDAAEHKPGEYTADYSFSEKGTYSLKVHAKNNSGLHEHSEHDVTVN